MTHDTVKPRAAQRFNCARCRDKGWFNAPDPSGTLTPTPCVCVRPNETALGYLGVLSMAAVIALLAMWWPL